MCLVASGCVEAYYEIGIHVWDVAAGSLLVTEAGGVLMDVEGKYVEHVTQQLSVGSDDRCVQSVLCVQEESWT